MDRLWYLTRDLAVSAYSVTGPAPAGTTHGCASDNWFSTYRFIDDDNGNLADGTPHAGIDLRGLRSARDRLRQRLRRLRTRPRVPAARRGADAVRVRRQGTRPARLDRLGRRRRATASCATRWAAGSASRRSATCRGAQTYFEDADVAPGVPYYYSVQPVGAERLLLRPGLQLRRGARRRVRGSRCDRAADRRRRRRPRRQPDPRLLEPGCRRRLLQGLAQGRRLRLLGGVRPVAIGVVSPDDELPRHGRSRGIRLRVSVIEPPTRTCASCTSAPSACVRGRDRALLRRPDFDGLESTGARRSGGECSIALSWSAAAIRATAPVTYELLPFDESRLRPGPRAFCASGLTGTTFSDARRRHGSACATTTSCARGRLREHANEHDTAGRDRRGRPHRRAPTPTTPATRARPSWLERHRRQHWTVRPPAPATRRGSTPRRARETTRDQPAWASRARRSSCGATPDAQLQLELRHRAGLGRRLRRGRDRGRWLHNWTKLDTVNYPGVMARRSAPACGGAGFADGEMVFTGTSGS